MTPNCASAFHGSDKNGGSKDVDLWSLIGIAIAVVGCDHCCFMDLMVEITTFEGTVLLVVWIVWKTGSCTYLGLSFDQSGVNGRMRNFLFVNGAQIWYGVKGS
ncbi:uncharacterized protein LOC144572943 [Carex rostrata]